MMTKKQLTCHIGRSCDKFLFEMVSKDGIVWETFSEFRVDKLCVWRMVCCILLLHLLDKNLFRSNCFLSPADVIMLFLLVDDSARVIVLLLICLVSFYFSNFVRDEDEKRKEGKAFLGCSGDLRKPFGEVPRRSVQQGCTIF
jgi:hypothetical protein